ncbi:Transcription factor DIVARICATA [Bienertia sinuspersici]
MIGGDLGRWTRAEDKLFEEALVLYGETDEEEEHRWKKIASHVPGRSVDELRNHYEALLHDIDEIDSGRVELPLFLIGLEKYGKGDWRSISRNVVVTRTPTQVASHAQKYYLRQSSGKKERKRSSIHDITTVDEKSAGQPAVEQNWIPPPAPAPAPAPGGNPVAQPQQTPLQQFGNDTAHGGTPFGYQNFVFPM